MRWTLLPLDKWENERLNTVSVRVLRKKKSNRKYKQTNKEMSMHLYLHETPCGSWLGVHHGLSMCPRSNYLGLPPVQLGRLPSFLPPQTSDLQLPSFCPCRQQETPKSPSSLLLLRPVIEPTHMVIWSTKFRWGAAIRIQTYKQSTDLIDTLNIRRQMKDECLPLLC